MKKEYNDDPYKGDFEWLFASIISAIAFVIFGSLGKVTPCIVSTIVFFITFAVFDYRFNGNGTGDGSTPTEYGA